MSTLELECPQCGLILRIDVGFAGGVCRCSNCGTLMTVPSSPDVEGFKRAPRSPRPHSPIQGPAQSHPNGGDNLQTSLQEAVWGTDPQAIAQTSTRARVARKKKRRGLRTAVVLGFVLFVGTIIGSGVFAIVVLMRGRSSTPPPGPQTIAQDILAAYDPDTNPFLLDKPNLLGLPIGTKTAVVIVADWSSRGWLALIKDAVLTGCDFEMTGMHLQVALGAEGGARVFPEDPVPLADLDRRKLKKFLAGFLALGKVDPAEAVKQALEDKPRQVVLVTGITPNDDQTVRISKLLKGANSVRFDAVLIDTESGGMRELAGKYEGQYVTLTAQKIKFWHNQQY